MYTIHDDELVARLETIAAQEARSVEDVLRSWVEFYALTVKASQGGEMRPSWDQQPAPIQTVLHNAYDKARRYWVEHGEIANASLTDKQMYEQFGRFDKEGIPRLKSDLLSLEPQPGSLAYTAWLAHQNPIPLESDAEETVLDRHPHRPKEEHG